jgi:glycogen phosphorylase
MSNNLLPRVAYFCMEYAVAESLPIYAGGLGVLAGDLMKAAGDLRLPVTGIGIFWSEGYTVQNITNAGDTVVDSFPATPRTALVATNVTVTVTIRGKDVPLTAWRVDLPNLAPLFLLEPTAEADRWITRRLYGGDGKDRIAQEIVLGVGGVRLLRALGIDVDVYHFNEGHAAFAGLELIREKMTARSESPPTFTTAWQATRGEVVFTSHSPVVAGTEVHDLDQLVEQGADLSFSPAELTAIGDSPFSMTLAGLRLSSVTNAVSELHGQTTRRMYSGLEGAAPIVAVTNGVHPWTWQDTRMRIAFGADRIHEAHLELKRELLAAIHARTGVVLDEARPLFGFARRAAPYKRADLILRDHGRIGPLLQARRLQLVVAGKAHPHDEAGKRILTQLAAAAHSFPDSVVYLQNFDAGIAQTLVRGCDVWLNTPRRPMEASGTSGMKAAMNGVLNVSILDGWWPEACEHGVNGWQFGDGLEGPGQDESDLRAVLDLVESEVLPAYEDRPRWTKMMRAAISTTQWRFSSHRMLEDYYLRVYRAATPLSPPAVAIRPPPAAETPGPVS